MVHRSCMCLPWMTASWTGRSSNGCWRSRLAKVGEVDLCCFWKWFGFGLVVDAGWIGICSDGCREWDESSSVSGFGWREGEGLGWFWCKKWSHILKCISLCLLARKVWEMKRNGNLLLFFSCTASAAHPNTPVFCFFFFCFFWVMLNEFWWLWWQGLKVNLIMTDYSMPGMTGYELLKKIKVCILFFSSSCCCSCSNSLIKET